MFIKFEYNKKREENIKVTWYISNFTQSHKKPRKKSSKISSSEEEKNEILKSEHTSLKVFYVSTAVSKKIKKFLVTIFVLEKYEKTVEFEVKQIIHFGLDYKLWIKQHKLFDQSTIITKKN